MYATDAVQVVKITSSYLGNDDGWLLGNNNQIKLKVECFWFFLMRTKLRSIKKMTDVDFPIATLLDRKKVKAKKKLTHLAVETATSRFDVDEPGRLFFNLFSGTSRIVNKCFFSSLRLLQTFKSCLN